MEEEIKSEQQNKPMAYDALLPAYFSDVECVNQRHKNKSGYYVRNKGWNDGLSKTLNPPVLNGYYFNEYMQFYNTAASGLPF